jgi:hypothetical protein
MAYQVWVYTLAGAKTAYLENAFNVKRTEKINAVPTLSFSYPNDSDNATKSALITSAYTVKVWNTMELCVR